MSKIDEKSGVDFESIALAVKEHKKEAMENHYKTAPEIPWEERSYLEGLWRFWRGHTKTTAINGRKVCHVYLVPADEARELLADREKLKKMEEALRIAVEEEIPALFCNLMDRLKLTATHPFQSWEENVLGNLQIKAIDRIRKCEK